MIMQLGPRIERPATLPEYLTTEQVAQLAHVGIDTVRKAVFLTRTGQAAKGTASWLPRARRIRAGFLATDVLAWLATRGQVPNGYEHLVPERRVGLAVGEGRLR